MLRIVLDTNVLINGIQDEFSFTNRIVELCLQGEVQPIISKAILSENKKLAKRTILDDDYLAHLDEYYKSTEMIYPKTKLHVIEDDPEDNKFLCCAFDGHADYIISDDHHLLEIEEFRGTKIKSPKEFWNIYQSEEGDSGESREWRDFMKTIGFGS